MIRKILKIIFSSGYNYYNKKSLKFTIEKQNLGVEGVYEKWIRVDDYAFKQLLNQSNWTSKQFRKSSYTKHKSFSHYCDIKFKDYKIQKNTILFMAFLLQVTYGIRIKIIIKNLVNNIDELYVFQNLKI